MGQRWVGNGGKDGTAWGLGRRQVEEERKKKWKGEEKDGGFGQQVGMGDGLDQWEWRKREKNLKGRWWNWSEDWRVECNGKLRKERKRK